MTDQPESPDEPALAGKHPPPASPEPARVGEATNNLATLPDSAGNYLVYWSSSRLPPIPKLRPGQAPPADP